MDAYYPMTWLCIIIKMVENRKEGGERSDICHHIYLSSNNEDKYNQHLVPSSIHGLGFENQRPILVGRRGKTKELFSNLLPLDFEV